MTDFNRFPFNNFTYYLTLFSKCFSSFLHSTCSLSNLNQTSTQISLLQITIRPGNQVDLKFELFPLHSPLLGESLLVSFPPLIDMLKFSGFSCLS
ncbi:hypothetical protein Glove_372g118 [Diversispora epigaea]|uniref:Uncharacterized protein n=1 Tax=Diversispora epigaea TaxID=1348612 RepID=A0A397H6J8_9GLOM|nr:hypothetical protein Glove_372g118 [Diversispora epigaea]